MIKLVKYILIPVLLFIVFLNYYSKIYKTIPVVYWDEEEWVSHGYFFEMLINGEIDNPLWKEPHLDTLLTSYVNGAAIYKDYLEIKKTKKTGTTTWLII